MIRYEHKSWYFNRPNSAGQTAYRRDRSIEDINKDIETIWKELQEIDKITHNGAQAER